MGVVRWVIGYVSVGLAALTALWWQRSSSCAHRHCRAGFGACAEPRHSLPTSDLADVRGADVHLVMNTFNRMAAEPLATEEAQLDQIFNLSDYLRHCLEHTLPTELELQQEIEMLESYLRLVAAFRRWELSLPVLCLPGTRDLKLRAHSTCLIAHALLCAHPAETAGRWTMPLRIGLTDEGGVAIDMTLRPLFTAGKPRIARVAEELQSLCDAMSGPALQWHYGIRQGAGPEVAVTVRISPCIPC